MIETVIVPNVGGDALVCAVVLIDVIASDSSIEILNDITTELVHFVGNNDSVNLPEDRLVNGLPSVIA